MIETATEHVFAGHGHEPTPWLSSTGLLAVTSSLSSKEPSTSPPSYTFEYKHHETYQH